MRMETPTKDEHRALQAVASTALPTEDGGPQPDQEKREVEFQLRVWQAMHPETAVEIVD